MHLRYVNLWGIFLLAVMLSAVFTSPYGHGEVIFEDFSLLPPRNFRFVENAEILYTKILYQDDFESQDPNWGANDGVPLRNNGNSPHVTWAHVSSNTKDADALNCPGGNVAFPHPSGSLMHIADGAGYGGGKGLRVLVKRGCDVGKMYVGSHDLRFTSQRKEVYIGYRMKIDPDFRAIRSLEGQVAGVKMPLRIWAGTNTWASSYILGIKDFTMQGGYMTFRGIPPEYHTAEHSLPYMAFESANRGRWFWTTVRVKLESCDGCRDGLREIWIDGNFIAGSYNEPTYYFAKNDLAEYLYSARFGMGNSAHHEGYYCAEYCGFVMDDIIVSTEYIPPPGDPELPRE